MLKALYIQNKVTRHVVEIVKVNKFFGPRLKINLDSLNKFHYACVFRCLFNSLLTGSFNIHKYII